MFCENCEEEAEELTTCVECGADVCVDCIEEGDLCVDCYSEKEES